MTRLPGAPLFRLPALLLTLGLSASAAFGATPPTVRDIVIRPPSAAETYGEMIDANMTMEAGAALDPAVLSEDIKRLYKTGKFSDVTTRVEALDTEGVRLVVEVRMRPMVRHIDFEGNARIKDKKIRSKVTHAEGVVLDEQQLSEDAKEVRSLYRDKGFVGTTVSVVKEEVPGKPAVDVTLLINESERSKVRKVTFAGNTVFSDRQLRKTIRTGHQWLSFVLNTGFLDENELAADRTRLARKYADTGYLDFTIDAVEREYSDNRNWVRIHFKVTEGEPYTVSEIAISGNTKFGTKELLAAIPLEEGDRFRRAKEQAGATAITNLYQQKGYLDARAVAQRTPQPEAHTVELQYRVHEGVSCTIRRIEIKGNRITQDRVIRRELGIYPGDLADSRKLDAAEKRLRNLGYFSSVDVLPTVTPETGERDLSVRVEETETGRLMLGGGFSTEDALVGMFEVSQSNFALMNWPTFRGGGQKLRLRAQLGTERNDFVLSFVEPWLFHSRLSLGTDVYIRDREYDEYTNEKAGLAVRLTRSWKRKWRQTVGLRAEQVELTDFSTLSPVLRSEEGTYDHHALLLSLVRDTRDSFINPRRGSRLSVSTELMAELWGSYADIYRVRGSLDRYFPVFQDMAIKLGVDMALSDSFSDTSIALFDRYFAGGASTLRGFDLRDVGPVDAGEPIGGKSLFLGTAELRVPLVEMIQGRVFCDAGNVWADTAEWHPSELNASVGLGIELRLPIGPVSLDYGIPVVTDQDDLDSDGRLHFNMGYTF